MTLLLVLFIFRYSLKAKLVNANATAGRNFVGCHIMMTSSNGSIFGVTGPLCGEITGHR